MSLVNIHFENPFTEWWRARKVFRFPHIDIQFYRKRLRDPRWKILNIDFRALNWKDKWCTARHVENPRIDIELFGLGFRLDFGAIDYDEFGDPRDVSLEYWEYMLDYLYYSKSLKISAVWYGRSQMFVIPNWGADDDKSQERLPVATYINKIALNKRGRKEFKKIYTDT